MHQQSLTELHHEKPANRRLIMFDCDAPDLCYWGKLQFPCGALEMFASRIRVFGPAPPAIVLAVLGVAGLCLRQAYRFQKKANDSVDVSIIVNAFSSHMSPAKSLAGHGFTTAVLAQTRFSPNLRHEQPEFDGLLDSRELGCRSRGPALQ